MNPETVTSATAQVALRHDIRTALTHILGYSEMLLEDLSSPVEQKELQGIHAQAGTLLQKLAAGTLLSEALAQIPDTASEILKATSRLRENCPAHLEPDLFRIRNAAETLGHLASAREWFTPSNSTSAASDVAGLPGTFRVEILVADDDANNRDLLSRQLERQGYHVTGAASGSEALKLLENRPFDLLLLDILMPGKSGFEVLEQVKAEPRTRDLPVMMISALDETASAVRCIEAGAEDFLAKPFDPVLLRARISAALERKRLRDEDRRHNHELELALEQLHQTQDRLLVQEKLASLGSLTAGIAHEIKNPLNFITNFAAIARDLASGLSAELEPWPEALATARPTLEQLDQSLDRIEHHGLRADRIVRAMLLHSRAQSGERQLADLNALISEAANLAYHGLRAQEPRPTEPGQRGGQFNVNLETTFDPLIGLLDIVPQDLSRVFLNIINNACYAAFENYQSGGTNEPKVTVQTQRLPGHVEVRIHDNGHGIPPETRSRIFEPFFSTKPAGAGTGLGLSLSREIVVTGHGGEIRVESQPGAWTEFIVTLPLPATNGASA